MAVGAVIAGLAAITFFGEPFGRGAVAIGKGISAILSPEIRPALVPEIGLKLFGVEVGAVPGIKPIEVRPEERFNGILPAPKLPWKIWPGVTLARPEDRQGGGAR